MQETLVRSLGWEDPLEKGMATHCSILAWRIPWTEEPGGPQAMGLQRTTEWRIGQGPPIYSVAGDSHSNPMLIHSGVCQHLQFETASHLICLQWNSCSPRPVASTVFCISVNDNSRLPITLVKNLSYPWYFPSLPSPSPQIHCLENISSIWPLLTRSTAIILV